MNKTLTVKEVSSFLKISPCTVYRYCDRGLLSCIKIGSILRVKKEDLDDCLSKHKKEYILTEKILRKALTNSFATNIDKAKGGELPKGKSKTRYNLGYGAIYQRKTAKGKIRWYLDYYDLEGERVQKVAAHAVTKEEAIDALRNAVFNEHYKELGIGRKKRKIGFREFAKIYLQDYIRIVRKNWQSDKYRLEKLKEFFKEIELREITPLMVEKFRAFRLKEGNTKSTTNRYLALLKKMLNLAIEEGYLEKNPASKVKLYSEKDTLKERVLTAEEEIRLMEASSEHLKSILIVALNTGMRRGEILNLQWKQIDLKARRIRVEKTKSGKFRFVNINTLLLEELLKLKSRNAKNSYLFFNPKTGNPLTTVKTAFKAACRRAGIGGLRFHDLRHTFASRLVETGVDVETIRSLLGHYSISITQRYTHSDDERKKKAVELLTTRPEIEGKKKEDLLRICDMKREKSLEKLPTPFFSVN